MGWRSWVQAPNRPNRRTLIRRSDYPAMGIQSVTESQAHQWQRLALNGCCIKENAIVNEQFKNLFFYLAFFLFLIMIGLHKCRIPKPMYHLTDFFDQNMSCLNAPIADLFAKVTNIFFKFYFEKNIAFKCQLLNNFTLYV